MNKGWNNVKIGQVRGPDNPNWKGGRIKQSGGYIKIKKWDHPRAEPNRGYVLEHIVIAEEKIGRYIQKDEQVHHINFIKDDNRPENLYVCKKQKEHKNTEKSLFNLVDKLIKKKIIMFENGEYRICHQM